MKLKPAGKVAILLLVAGGAFGAFRFLTKSGSLGSLIPEAQRQGSMDVAKIELPTISGQAPAQPVENLTMPSNQAASITGPKIKWLLWAWNAQMGLLFANGGKSTTTGSLMSKNGVHINFERQDDATKMQESLVAFATSLSRGNPQPDQGTHFVTIMGDGAAAFLASLNQNLEKLGPEYRAKIVGACGFSRGEDKFMGPASWKQNPASSKGGVVAGFLRDGDWNIAQKWLGDNQLRNNPNEKTYDPDALNWFAANDYIDAAEKYITGFTEERDVVKNGKKTGERKKIKIDAVVTWTPGDVNIADKKGGLISIVSTKEYSAQMPCVIIGIDKWCKDNRSTVENMLDGVNKGGDVIKQSQEGLRRAGEISASVYGEKDASYWIRYYAGAREKDRGGVEVDLGGSSVNNLADNMYLFGCVPGSANTFAAVYKVFGDIVKTQYPEIVPSYPPVDQILDTTYLIAVAKKSNFNPDLGQPKPVAKDTGKPNSVIGKRNWKIEFRTGQASFTPAATQTLEALLRDLLVAGNTTVEIGGHTDNVGNSDANMRLSEARATAVKQWLLNRAPKNFDGRLEVRAYGQSAPIAPNTSEASRSANRRVEIKISASN